MKLPKENVELFYKLYHPLLVYVNKKFNIVRGINSPEDFKKFPIEEINKLRDRLYKHPELINSFVVENPLNFSNNELKIISSWKDFVKGRFLIFRYLKSYAVFLDTDEPPKAYGVLALNTTFEEIVGSYLPIMVEAVLLPFNDKIIYDSIFSPYSITFGSGIRRSLNDAYQKAKSRFGIITSLPFSIEKVEQSDADKLRFYLRSEHNRKMYWEEIEELINKDPNLLTLYHQEMGKIHARTYGKRLREIGLTNAWFAILEGITIASGATRDEVERILQCILPTGKRKFVYIFQLKKK
ncbi:hypothetical protein HKBW3S42_00107 [Candidatus Hakubella thermalkaliphila]|uniref:Uncharacterized protein n=2 Tax=Candidatus Hakubella thermalkaliphila TaxID=2754717 RepID=A0A6V8PQT7_9ACTN|nr:hypothetical protein [Candidatus Hakubella thermalkaliphila]MBT9170409.1 hypothetical protein [Actinomycetota bacterium]GFP31801.1 hypothetical protein HKBW3S42_00107 [Candidatus Hakubella thermalkaliphila]GFP34708.1 hypothetical protein HKBW3S43_00500 [Candidatus Hakubella thermalkaliphila]